MSWRVWKEHAPDSFVNVAEIGNTFSSPFHIQEIAPRGQDRRNLALLALRILLAFGLCFAVFPAFACSSLHLLTSFH